MGKLLRSYLVPHPPIIIPAVGQGSHGRCFDTYRAMQAVAEEIQALRPKRIVLISPHGTVFSDGMGVLYNERLRGDLADFGHPEIDVAFDNDKAFVEQLVHFAGLEDVVLAKIDEPFAASLQITDRLDHGALVPLWFLKEAGVTVDLVHITYGLLPTSTLYRFGMVLRNVIKKAGGDTVLIASGDMSHALQDLGPYAYHPHAKAFDEAVLTSVRTGDPYPLLTYPQKLREEAKECGFRSMAIAWGAYDRMMVASRVLSYEGPFGVGYLVGAMEEMDGIRPSYLEGLKTHERQVLQNCRDTEDDYVKLARETIQEMVLNGKRLDRDVAEKTYQIAKEARGCFVSIKNEAGLRGCIGTIYPTRSDLIDEIIDNAVKAATKDPRFEPIEPEELDDLLVSVDILMTPERVLDERGLDPKRYGVIVTAGFKKGLLLPNLEGVDTVEEQLRIAKSKAGIVNEPYVLDRFEVIRHEGDRS